MRADSWESGRRPHFMLEIWQEIVIVNHYFHHCLHCCIHHFIMMISSSIFLSISRPLCQFTHETFHSFMKNDHICHISKNLQIMYKCQPNMPITKHICEICILFQPFNCWFNGGDVIGLKVKKKTEILFSHIIEMCLDEIVLSNTFAA